MEATRLAGCSRYDSIGGRGASTVPYEPCRFSSIGNIHKTVSENKVYKAWYSFDMKNSEGGLMDQLRLLFGLGKTSEMQVTLGR